MNNREIKFRVWNGVNMEHRVMAGFLGAFYCEGLDPKDSACMSPANTIYYTQAMQFTGLKDRNGKEIYEGDIVSSTREIGRWFKTGTKFIVRWNPYLCNYALCPTTYKNHSEKINAADLTAPKTKVMTVLGNIFENPELVHVQ